MLVVGGEEAAQLGRDGEHAAPWSDEDGAVGGESAEVGVADVGELEAGGQRQVDVGVGLLEGGRVVEQLLKRRGLVREGFEELGDRRRRALLVDDEPQLSASVVGVVGQAAQGRVSARNASSMWRSAAPRGRRAPRPRDRPRAGWRDRRSNGPR